MSTSRHHSSAVFAACAYLLANQEEGDYVPAGADLYAQPEMAARKRATQGYGRPIEIYEVETEATKIRVSSGEGRVCLTDAHRVIRKVGNANAILGKDEWQYLQPTRRCTSTRIAT